MCVQLRWQIVSIVTFGAGSKGILEKRGRSCGISEVESCVCVCIEERA